MVTDFPFLLQSIAWPLALLLAWLLGDRLYERWQVPRVTSYVAVGLVAGLLNLPGLTGAVPGLPFLANVALALVMFELGYRINLRWFRHNPWVLALGVGESLLTFGLVYLLTGWFGLDDKVRLVIAAVAISASPAGIVRVANELRSAGQVTERVLHLCAINCLMAFMALKLMVGYWHLSTSGDLVQAGLNSVYVLTTSAALGVVFGVAVPWLLSAKRMQSTAVTVVFALTVLLLTTACYGLKLSPLLAALSFGIVARERRVHLTNAQRDFGSVGELLGIFLFVYVASLVQWPSVLETLALGVALLLVRSLSKVVCNLAVARLSGITERKGWLTGLALTPMSAFVILLLEQTRLSGFEPATQAFAVMAGFLVLLELLGPVVTQRSLMASNETHITLEPALGPATAPDAQGQSRESSRAT